MRTVLNPYNIVLPSYRIEVIATGWNDVTKTYVDVGRVWHFTITDDQLKSLKISYDPEGK